MSPDWSHVTSMDAARALVADGELEPLLLLPEAFGGQPTPENTVYVPRGFVDVRDRTVSDLVAGLIASGSVDSFTATPEYAGDSVVPVRIRMRAWREGHRGGVQPVLEIWGSAEEAPPEKKGLFRRRRA